MVPTKRIYKGYKGSAYLLGHASYLHIFSECPDDLFGHLECSREALSSCIFNKSITGVMMVEVSDGLLQSQEVVHCEANNVQRCALSTLSTKIVLEAFEGFRRGGGRWILRRGGGRRI